MTWEYKTFKLVRYLAKGPQFLDAENVKSLDEALNDMSIDGWELVTYTSFCSKVILLVC